MTILISCKRCRRAYHYPERRQIETTCPDCESGPMDHWFTEIEVADA